MNGPLSFYQRLCPGLLAGAFALGTFVLGACSTDPAPPRPASAPVKSPPPAASADSPEVHFVDVAAEAGFDFVHRNGASPAKLFPETMGGGGAFWDYDADGWLDIYAVNGGDLTDPSITAANALFHNRGDGTFSESAAAAGLAHAGYGMGCVAGDTDNDGDQDLYIANYGANAFFRNRGDGTFEDRSESSGTDDARWGTSCALGDYDLDGDLDLYVANYVAYTPADQDGADMPYMTPDESGADVLGYPHPANFPGSADVLYRNEGDGTFADVSRVSGVDDEGGKGLGVVFGDYDRDGWPDIYVANDAVRNFLYRNGGDGTFAETGVATGVAYGQDGQMEAGMGVDWGDYDNDGDLDLTVTNFQAEPNALYANQGDAFFATATFSSGTGLVTLPFLGFGTHFMDFDNDGFLDLFVANGHVLDNVDRFDASASYPQRNLFFRNRGPDVHGNYAFDDWQAGPGAALLQPSRGSAAGDYDNDGDLDLAIFNVGYRAALLRNDGGNRRRWLALALEGTTANRDAVGARVSIGVGKETQTREVRAGRGYLSQSDRRLLFGLGDASEADWVEIHWPGGTSERFGALEAGRLHRLIQGQGRPAGRP